MEKTHITKVGNTAKIIEIFTEDGKIATSFYNVAMPLYLFHLVNDFQRKIIKVGYVLLNSIEVMSKELLFADFEISIDINKYIPEITGIISEKCDEYKTIISIITNFRCDINEIEFYLETKEKYVWKNTNNDNFLTFLYLLTKSYLEKTEFKIIVNRETNEVVNIEYHD